MKVNKIMGKYIKCLIVIILSINTLEVYSQFGFNDFKTGESVKNIYFGTNYSFINKKNLNSESMTFTGGYEYFKNIYSKRNEPIIFLLLNPEVNLSASYNDSSLYEYTFLQNGYFNFISKVILKQELENNFSIDGFIGAGYKLIPKRNDYTNLSDNLIEDVIDEFKIDFGGEILYNKLLYLRGTYVHRWYTLSSRTKDYFNDELFYPSYFRSYQIEFGVNFTSGKNTLITFLTWDKYVGSFERISFYKLGIRLSINDL